MILASSSSDDDLDNMPVMGGKRISYWQEHNSIPEDPSFTSPNSSYASPDESDGGIGQKLMVCKIF
jgi:hypothetical protein